MTLSWRRAVLWSSDAALAGLVWLFTVTQWGTRNFAELEPPGPEHTAAPPDWGSFALVLAATLPVLYRRRNPVAVLAITAAAGVALAALGYGVTVHLGPAVALYTIAVRLPRPRMAPVVVLTAASFVAIAVLMWFRLDAHGDFGVDLVLWAVAWIVGDRRRLARQAEVDVRERAERAQREAEGERRLTVVEERARIARELHDSAGHAINTILVQAGAARVHHERDPAQAGAAIRTIEQVARETIDDIDRIVGALREDGPAETAPLPGVDAIETLVERQREAGLAVSFSVSGERRRLPPAVDRAAYRIAQEALTNAARHGDGSAEVRVDFGPDAVCLEVVNGVGHPAAPRPGGGRGLIGMRERASLLGGTLQAERDGDLFLVLASLPYVREHA